MTREKQNKRRGSKDPDLSNTQAMTQHPGTLPQDRGLMPTSQAMARHQRTVHNHKELVTAIGGTVSEAIGAPVSIKRMVERQKLDEENPWVFGFYAGNGQPIIPAAGESIPTHAVSDPTRPGCIVEVMGLFELDRFFESTVPGALICATFRGWRPGVGRNPQGIKDVLCGELQTDRAESEWPEALKAAKQLALDYASRNA